MQFVILMSDDLTHPYPKPLRQWSKDLVDSLNISERAESKESLRRIGI